MTTSAASDNLVRAPFSPEQVVSLNGYQRAGAMHPFTCANRTAVPHRPHDIDLGLLEATEAGWRCADCDYVQDWAWVWMADGSWEQIASPRPFLLRGV